MNRSTTTKTERLKEWFQTHIKIPRSVIIAICILPVILTALFYALRSYRGVMDWVVFYISQPVRSFFGLLSSLYPFSIMEIVSTALVVFLIYYVVKSVRDTSRRREKWKLLGKRLLPILIVACYLWCAFCWLWNSGYHSSGFAARSGFSGEGVSVSDLTAVTQLFADRACELSMLVERDEESRYISNRRVMFAESTRVYRNISGEFPSLGDRLYAPNAMIYSWLMSITGYSGFYFALTGEAMINTQTPGAFMPYSVAHEHAHQLGVFAEDEASFVGILACVTSENTTFEYAGYLSGLNYLLSALVTVDADAVNEIIEGLTAEVNTDRYENYIFWASRTTANTGVDFLDRFLSTVMETTSDAVNTAYDGFLRSQNQELGIKSYGACVDLLVEHFAIIAAEAEMTDEPQP